MISQLPEIIRRVLLGISRRWQSIRGDTDSFGAMGGRASRQKAIVKRLLKYEVFELSSLCNWCIIFQFSIFCRVIRCSLLSKVVPFRCRVSGELE